MKAFSKIAVLTVVMTILTISPLLFLSVPGTAQATSERVAFTVGAGGVGGDLGDWDPTIVTTGSFGAIEGLIGADQNYNVYGILATSWTIHPRPDEESSQGLNTGGVEAISFVLREGVKFTDGSDWNATVAKWNIDRNDQITGFNSTYWRSRWWFNPAGMVNYFTPNWNLSWYASNPFGNGLIPIINRTEIVDDYEIKCYLNRWSTRLYQFGLLGFISMETYKDYFYTPIRGYGATAGFEASVMEHMVGTGPYKLTWYDKIVAQSALAQKNENYWNKTALEADGMFVVDDVYTRWYATSGARSTALLAGDTDATGWQLQNQLSDLPGLDADPNIETYPTTKDPSIDCINMLSTEGADIPLYAPFISPSLNGLSGMTFRQMFPILAQNLLGQPAGTQLPGGVNRTVRLALSKAFNYDGYVSAAYEVTGGGVRCYSAMGSESLFYDPSVPYPMTNIAEARQILFADPYYAAELGARGLTVESSDADWINVSAEDPVRTYTFLSVAGSYKQSYLEEALNKLGFALEVTLSTDIHLEWMVTHKAYLFDMWSYIWYNEIDNPMEFYGLGMRLLYGSRQYRLPYGGHNFALTNNATLDKLMEDIPFAGGEVQQEMYNNLSYELMNYHSPWLYLGHAQQGIAANVKWDVSRALGTGMTLNVAWIGFTETESSTTPTPPKVPGYSPLILISVGLLSIAGIVYGTIRKRK